MWKKWPVVAESLTISMWEVHTPRETLSYILTIHSSLSLTPYSHSLIKFPFGFRKVTPTTNSNIYPQIT